MRDEHRLTLGAGETTVANVLVRNDGRMVLDFAKPKGRSRAGNRAEHERIIMTDVGRSACKI